MSWVALFYTTIVSTLRQPQYIRKYIKEDLIKVLFNLLNQKPLYCFYLLKDAHREKAPSNKTPGLRKNTNMGVWVVGTLNQLFIRGS